MSLNLNRPQREIDEDARKADERERRRKRILPQKYRQYTGLLLWVPLLLILVSLPIIALVMVSIDSYHETVAHSRLNSSGREIDAQISPRYTEISRKNHGKSYELTYDFSVDGHFYRGKSEVRTPPSARVMTIIYDPEDPNNSKIKGGEDTFESSTLPFFGSMILIIILGLVVWAMRH